MGRKAGTPREAGPASSGWFTWGTEAGKRRILLAAFCGIYAVMLVWLLRGTEVILSADLHTEEVSFRAVDPGKAVFFVDGLVASLAGSDRPRSCLTGSFAPARNAVVAYGRRGDGPIEVTVTPAPGPGDPDALEAGRFAASDGSRPMSYRGMTYLTADPACKPDAAAQFPVWGEVQVGQEMRPQAGADRPEPGLLIDGTLEVAARSRLGGRLYTVTTLRIPVGGRLETYDEAQTATKAPLAGAHRASGIWWGMAYVDSLRTGLVVELGTEAPQVALYRPNRTVADVIEASGLTQLTDDPGIARLHIFLLMLVGIALFAEWLGKFLHELGMRR